MAYFTYKFPTATGAVAQNYRTAWSINPTQDMVKQEGRFKETYTWNYNKPMLFTFKKLKWVSNLNPERVNSNSLINLQYCKAITTHPTTHPFFDADNHFNHENEESYEEKEDYEIDNYSNTQEDRDATLVGAVALPDVNDQNVTIFFGRIVLVAPASYRFNVEILYDTYFYR